MNKIYKIIPIIIIIFFVFTISVVFADDGPPVGELPEIPPFGIGGQTLDFGSSTQNNESGTPYEDPQNGSSNTTNTQNQTNDDPDDNEEAGFFDNITGYFKTIVSIKFPFDSFREAILATFNDSLVDIMGQEYSGDYSTDYGKVALKDVMKEVVDSTLSNLFFESANTETILEIRKQAWDTMMYLSGALLGLTLIFNIVLGLKDSTTSVTGLADAKQIILNWLINAGIAAASYWIISAFIRLSTSASLGTFQALTSNVTSSDIAASLIKIIFAEKVSNVAFGVGSLPFVLLFNFILILTVIYLVGSIILVSFSRFVIFLIVIAAAPLIYGLGTISQFKWLVGIFNKATVIALIVPILNSLIMGMVVNLTTAGLFPGDGFLGTLFRIILALGLASVLLMINSMVIKIVYGAAGNIINKAVEGTKAVVAVAINAGMMAAGAGIAGLAGGAASSAATTAGGGGTPALSGGGNFLQQSTNPLVRGIGNGANHFVRKNHPFGSDALSYQNNFKQLENLRKGGSSGNVSYNKAKENQFYNELLSSPDGSKKLPQSKADKNLNEYKSWINSSKMEYQGEAHGKMALSQIKRSVHGGDVNKAIDAHKVAFMVNRQNHDGSLRDYSDLNKLYGGFSDPVMGDMYNILGTNGENNTMFSLSEEKYGDLYSSISNLRGSIGENIHGNTGEDLNPQMIEGFFINSANANKLDEHLDVLANKFPNYTDQQKSDFLKKNGVTNFNSKKKS